MPTSVAGPPTRPAWALLPENVNGNARRKQGAIDRRRFMMVSLLLTAFDSGTKGRRQGINRASGVPWSLDIVPNTKMRPKRRDLPATAQQMNRECAALGTRDSCARHIAAGSCARN